MSFPWLRRILPFVAGVLALAGLGAVSSTAANTLPPNFDIFATTGHIHKATQQNFNLNANANGEYIIGFTSVVNKAKLDGITVFP